ncbi:hypothetical protein [Pseudoxanthomonas winnipegensis]|uniref:hypothetical protein n=1 Tax=Pseudoxanthomonas winnipegensis TaxID=2480810 RepID=UPI0013EF2E82|nr:hypothetical protein [Pseudoxanthomonas winnipegensis]
MPDAIEDCLARIEAKLDALIEALADEQEEEDKPDPRATLGDGKTGPGLRVRTL